MEHPKSWYYHEIFWNSKPLVAIHESFLNTVRFSRVFDGFYRHLASLSWNIEDFGAIPQKFAETHPNAENRSWVYLRIVLKKSWKFSIFILEVYWSLKSLYDGYNPVFLSKFQYNIFCVDSHKFYRFHSILIQFTFKLQRACAG